MVKNELTHHGIKGQKWYVRRFQNKDGTLTAAGKKRYNSEMEKLKAEEKVLKNKQKTQAKLDKLEAKRKEIERLKESSSETKKEDSAKKTAKKISEMTDDEIKEKIARMDLENKYRQLMAQNVKEVKVKSEGRVKKTVKDALERGASDIGSQAASYLLGKGVNFLLGRLFDGDQIVNPKKAQKAK